MTMIKIGNYAIEKYRTEIREGDLLWDTGWRVTLKRIFGIKFLFWSRK